MATDQIADLLTRVRNAQRAGHPAVAVPASKTKERVLKVLQDEGYIASFESAEDSDGKPLRRMSRPGRRLYVGSDNIPVQRGGLGLVVVSTSKGMLSDREARRLGVGGELICAVF